MPSKPRNRTTFHTTMTSISAWFCRHCGDKLPTKSALHNHLALRHPPPGPSPRPLFHNPASFEPIYCDICDREFRSEAGLQSHIANSKVHKKAAKQYAAAQAKPTPPPTQPGNRWCVIPASQQPAALAALTAHCHTPDDLTKHQFLLQPYGPADLDALRKCKHCGGIQKKMHTRAITECTYHPGQRQPYRFDKNRAHTCCGETGRGCASRPEHEYLSPDWWLVTKFQEYASTPARSHTRKRPAVTLDCEMAGVVGNVGQVVLLCAADYLTGETIINKHVQPTSRVVDWRTRVSGVTQQTMAAAIARGEALAGWREAREELWKFVDADTVLIGHSLQNDLDVLRVIHANVVDSAILARNAVDPGGRQWGLKGLCEELLGVDVQTNGMRGHDCLEDVMATREVVLCCTREPGKLQGWAEEARAKEEALKAQRELEKLEKKKQAEREKEERERKERKQSQRAEDTYGEYSDDEVVLWSDIAEDLGWPHPNTGYDPWSD